MARFMVSMPDEMIKKLDRRAQEEHRSRSELLREAARRHLAAEAPGEAEQRPTRRMNGKQQEKWTKKALERYLLEKGLGRKGYSGLDSLIGPTKGPVDMQRILRVTKRLTGLSRQIIEDREDRL